MIRVQSPVKACGFGVGSLQLVTRPAPAAEGSGMAQAVSL